MLVAGGGDSALEAATSIAAEADTNVVLVYRGDGFVRAKEANRQRVAQAQASGHLDVMLRSNLEAIGDNCVTVVTETAKREIPNDNVIVCAGGVLPTKMLREIGIEVETKYGAP